MTNRQSQHIAVIGAGASGEAAASLLLYQGARVTLLDSDPSAGRQAAERIGSPELVVVSGVQCDEVVRAFGPFDLAVLSPGIDPAVPMVSSFREAGVPLIAEIELAFRENRAPVVAITGTNGKTTTTALAGEIFAAGGKIAPPCGNIGRPFSDVVLSSAFGQVKSDIALLEVSSFQLEAIETFHPKVAAWLNFSPDHLDRYPDLESYRCAKLCIFKNQTSDDIAIVNLRDYPLPTAAQQITFSAFDTGGDFSRFGTEILYHGEPVADLADTALVGAHNAENAMAALAIGLAFGISFDAMRPALRSFRLAPHRLEIVGSLLREGGEIRFINDSKSTNVDSLEKALGALHRPAILIAGGKDKGFDYSTLAEFVAAKARLVILIGEIRYRLAALWSKSECRLANSLEEAVVLAATIAMPGEDILFSPGTSSFDMFKNYAERGERFRAAVRALPGVH